jgi:hypothetical protein
MASTSRIEVSGLTPGLEKTKNPTRLPAHPITLMVIDAGCRAKLQITPAQHEHGVK